MGKKQHHSLYKQRKDKEIDNKQKRNGGQTSGECWFDQFQDRRNMKACYRREKETEDLKIQGNKATKATSYLHADDSVYEEEHHY